MNRNRPHILAVVFILVLIAIVFREFLIKGWLPIPYDMLTGWYFPYTLGGWEGYYPGIAHKGGLHAADVFRQMIPWKQLSLEIIKSGQLPLWNPYSFSGEPLWANVQIFAIYPLTLLFLLPFDFHYLWGVYIFLSPLLTLLFTYLFLQAFKLRKPAVLIGALSFAFSGHMVSWLEWGVVTHTALWLPLLLWSLTKWIRDNQPKAIIVTIFTAFACITGGYMQEAAYALILASVYFVFLWARFCNNKLQTLWRALGVAMVTILLTIPQVLPTYKLYVQSALKGSTSKQLFLRTQYNPIRALTIISPDYFGSRVKENYWGDKISEVDYTDGNLFFGSLALLSCVYYLLVKTKPFVGKFFIASAVTSFLLAIKPFAQVLTIVQIPMISTGDAAGIIFITVFSLSMVSAFGLDSMLRNVEKKKLILVSLLYFGLVLTILTVPPQYSRITIRGVLPYALIAVSSLISLLVYPLLVKRLRQFVPVVLITLTSVEILFYCRLMLSFSPRVFAFPQHPAISAIRDLAGYNRTVGYFDADIATNLHTGFRIYNSQGYNPLHLKHYQYLSAATNEGKYTEKIERSDAIINMNNIVARERFFELTSTKYVLARVSKEGIGWDIEPLKYNPQFYNLVWQQGRFKIYEQKHALPRVAIYTNYEVHPDEPGRINRLYDQNFHPLKTLILEANPTQVISLEATGSASIKSYSPNQVVITSQTTGGNSLLLLTDTYYDSWRAKIDEKEVPVFKANQSFRAIILPSGEHTTTYTIGWP